MDRRGFLKLFAAIPLIRDIPLIPILDKTSGDTHFTSAYKYAKTIGGASGETGGGGGGGGAGGLCILIKNMPAQAIQVTARGGYGGQAPIFGKGNDGNIVLERVEVEVSNPYASYEFPVGDLGEFNKAVNEGRSLEQWLKVKS